MRKHPLYIVLSLVIAVILAGDLLFSSGIVPSSVPREAQHAHLDVVVCSAPSGMNGAWSADVRHCPDGIRLRLVGPDSVKRPEVGDALTVDATLVPTENRLLTAPSDTKARYSRRLNRQGIVATAFGRRVVNHGASPEMRLTERMLRKRGEWVAAYRAGFDDEICGVLAAMTLGDRTFLSSGRREVYSLTGSSHVLALSGLHLSVIVALLYLLFLPFRMWRWGQVFSALALLFCCWGFVLVAGMPLSLVRAAGMLTVCGVLQACNRRVEASDYIPLAVTLVLVCSPGALFDVGFQLSVISVSAIVWGAGTARKLPYAVKPSFGMLFSYRRVRYVVHHALRTNPLLRGLDMVVSPVVRYVGSLLMVSVFAVVATMPLVLHTFGMVTVIGIPASVVAVPTALLLVFAGLSYVALPPLRGILEPVIGFLYHIQASTLEALSQCSWATLRLRITIVGVLAAYVALIWLMRTAWWRHWRGWCGAMVAVMAVWLAELLARVAGHLLQIAL